MSTHEGETISYPSIAIVLGLAYLIYRYFTGPSTAAATSNSSSSNTRPAGLHFTPAQVDQVTSMFPQLSRRDIMWDLQRNRGSVQATIERVLTGRGLDPAPPSFQPNVPLPVVQQSTSTSTATSKKAEPDLIQRYNLQTRIASEEKGKAKEEIQGSGWATTKESRQENLRKRRDDMILQARRKMMEKDKLKQEAAAIDIAGQ